jgi:vacuolar-type H+-ATPase subunit I/STV1
MELLKRIGSISFIYGIGLFVYGVVLSFLVSISSDKIWAVMLQSSSFVFLNIMVLLIIFVGSTKKHEALIVIAMLIFGNLILNQVGTTFIFGADAFSLKYRWFMYLPVGMFSVYLLYRILDVFKMFGLLWIRKNKKFSSYSEAKQKQLNGSLYSSIAGTGALMISVLCWLLAGGPF